MNSPAESKMPSPLRPALTLVVITPFLTELLSGSQSPINFFFPPVFFFLLFVYGIPILLIRDYWITSGARLPTLIFLGLAYGLYNEGIVAKTLLMSQNVPLGVFNGSTIGGINFAWAALIVPWHALQAVTAPIILVSWLYPTSFSRPWLSRKLIIVGIVISTLVGVSSFLLTGPSASPIYLFTYLALIVGLALLAPGVKSGVPFLNLTGFPELRDLALGLGFYPSFVVSLCLLAATHAPTFLILATSILWSALLIWFLSRGNLTLTRMTIFCLSDCLSAAAITGIIMALHGNLEGASADVLLALLFIIGLRMVWHRGPAELE